MCDTMVVVPDSASPRAPVWFGKNSDREPGEAQIVEHLPFRKATGRTLRATHIAIPEVADAQEVVLSRPAWMWGAEMGANASGVVIGNEAVFTRIEVDPVGLTGMDLLRITLERATSADEALELLTWLLARYGQGGRAGYRNQGFRYHNSFLIADAEGAHLLETAGRFWASVRVRGIRTTSNVLTIGEEATRLGPGTADEARRRGFVARGETFDFRRAFGAEAFRVLSGGDVRRACTLRSLEGASGLSAMLSALRSHGEQGRWLSGLRMTSPCAHASFLPTRTSGQTTGSMISRLTSDGATHLLTGTSSPCLSVFKPVPLGKGWVDTGPPPRPEGADDQSLFWRHERLHRAVLRDETQRRAALLPLRLAMESSALSCAESVSADAASALWEAHRAELPAWTDAVVADPPRRRLAPRDVFWKVTSLRDGLRGA